MKILVIVLTTLLSMKAFAKVKVAVIDTGLVESPTYEICGTKDFTNTEIADRDGHGSNVSALIDQYAGDSDYCQLVIKYYQKGMSKDNLLNTIRAFKYAIEQKVDIINYSGGGLSYDATERYYVRKALALGIKVVVAAGNEGVKGPCKFYPACYDDRIIVVSAKDVPQANDNSKVDVYHDGNNIFAGGHLRSGTSQSTAIETGLQIKQMSSK